MGRDCSDCPRPGAEGKVVFRDSAVIWEGLKRWGRGIAALAGKIKRLCKRRGAPSVAEAPSPRREALWAAGGGTEAPTARPWPEHEIELIEEAIRAKGYVKWEQSTLGTVKGYTFYQGDGTARFLKAELLLSLHLAKKRS